MTRNKNRLYLPCLMILLQSLLYGFGDPISKAAYERVPVFSLLTVRYSIAFLFLLLLGRGKMLREWKENRSKAWILPSLCISLSFLLSNLGLKLTTATSAAFLRSLSTVMTPLLALIFLRKKYRVVDAVIGLCSVVGLYLLCGIGGLSGFGMGEVMCLASALLMAAALLLGQRALTQMSALSLTALQAGVSAVLAAAAALSMEGGLRLSGATLTVWGVIFYLAITCTALGFLLQNHALRRISAKSVALLQCIYPVLTAVFSFLLLHERLGAAGMIGSVIIIGCVAAQILSDSRAPAQA